MLGVKFRRGFRRSLIPGAEPAASPQGWDGFFGFFQGVFPWEKKKKKRLLIPVLIPSGIHPRREPPKWGENRKKRGKKNRGGKKNTKNLFSPLPELAPPPAANIPKLPAGKRARLLGVFMGLALFWDFFFFFPFLPGDPFKAAAAELLFLE